MLLHWPRPSGRPGFLCYLLDAAEAGTGGRNRRPNQRRQGIGSAAGFGESETTTERLCRSDA